MPNGLDRVLVWVVYGAWWWWWGRGKHARAKRYPDIRTELAPAYLIWVCGVGSQVGRLHVATAAMQLAGIAVAIAGPALILAAPNDWRYTLASYSLFLLPIVANWVTEAAILIKTSFSK